MTYRICIKNFCANGTMFCFWTSIVTERRSPGLVPSSVILSTFLDTCRHVQNVCCINSTYCDSSRLLLNAPIVLFVLVGYHQLPCSGAIYEVADSRQQLLYQFLRDNSLPNAYLTYYSPKAPAQYSWLPHAAQISSLR